MRMMSAGMEGVCLETDRPPEHEGGVWLFGMGWDEADALMDRLERMRLHWKGPVEARVHAWKAYDYIESALSRLEGRDDMDAMTATIYLREAMMHLEQSLKGLNAKEVDE